MRYVSNPTRPGGRRPVELITDRAKRYRANATADAGEIGPPACCHYCGQKAAGRLMVDHVDGIEDHGEPDNLTWACRSCNGRKGFTLRDAGIAKLTRQYNPTKAGGAANAYEYFMAVSTILRRDKKTGRLRPADASKQPMMPVGEAVAMIRATPHWRRQEFAGKIWSNRRARGTDRPVPF